MQPRIVTRWLQGPRPIDSRRAALVLAGRLTGFEEHEISADTERWGNVAHRLSASWRISSMAWDDERPGLSPPA